MTDPTPSDTAFPAIASALAPLPPAESEALLAYLLASVGHKRRPGLPRASIKAELTEMLGKAVDAVEAPAGPGKLPEGVAG